MKTFLADLPYTHPLFMTEKGDAAVNLEPVSDGSIALKWLASIHRGAGRAALAAIVKAADHHGVTLQLIAKPQRPTGAGKRMTPRRLELFYAGFGFVTTGHHEKFARMTRKPHK
jgi:hypothetical protein